MSASLESIIDAARSLADYHTQKTLYECDCLIREKLAELRQIDYTSRASVQRAVTVTAHVCEFKINLLKEKIATLSPDYQRLWTVFIFEAEVRIAFLKEYRKKC